MAGKIFFKAGQFFFFNGGQFFFKTGQIFFKAGKIFFKADQFFSSMLVRFCSRLARLPLKIFQRVVSSCMCLSWSISNLNSWKIAFTFTEQIKVKKRRRIVRLWQFCTLVISLSSAWYLYWGILYIIQMDATFHKAFVFTQMVPFMLFCLILVAHTSIIRKRSRCWKEISDNLSSEYYHKTDTAGSAYFKPAPLCPQTKENHGCF